jgi:hypothetical protein
MVLSQELAELKDGNSRQCRPGIEVHGGSDPVWVDLLKHGHVVDEHGPDLGSRDAGG